MSLASLSNPPATVKTPSNQVFIMVHPLSKLFTDDTPVATKYSAVEVIVKDILHAIF